MKKQKYYLAAGVLACSAISGLAMPLANTFAEGTGSQTRDVTVGEVDETVYSVDIDWGDMTFDWKYAGDINKFGFEPSRTCLGEPYQHGELSNDELNSGILYSDSSCTVVVEEEPEEGATVYSKSGFENYVTVQDGSTNGKVKVSASFTPENNYDWVNGEFVAGGYWTDGESLSYLDISRENYLVIGDDIYYYYGDNYNNGQIPEHVDFPGLHYASLVLKTNPSTDLSSVNVAANDKIGTVTITIEPDLN